MNYITEIERELQLLYSRTEKMKIALEVIKELRARDTGIIEAAAERIEPHKALAAPKKTKTRKRYGENITNRMRAAIVSILTEHNRPMKSNELVPLVSKLVEASDTSFWYAAKTLANDGTIIWDTETRLYSINRSELERKAS